MPIALLDLDTRELIGVNGARRPLTSRYRFRALARLHLDLGRFVSREALIRAVYVEEVDRLGRDFIAADYDDTFNNLMRYVRQELRRDGYSDDVLVCYPAEGYRLDLSALQREVGCDGQSVGLAD